MERLGQTPRKEQKSIFDFLSPLSAEDAEKKAAEQKEADAKVKEAREQRRKEKHTQAPETAQG